jgi:hypothetical protein
MNNEHAHCDQCLYTRIVELKQFQKLIYKLLKLNISLKSKCLTQISIDILYPV